MPPNEVQRLLRGILEVRLDSLMLGFPEYTQIQGWWIVILQTQSCILFHHFCILLDHSRSFWIIYWKKFYGMPWSLYIPSKNLSSALDVRMLARPSAISTSRACCTEISNRTIWWYDAPGPCCRVIKTIKFQAMRTTSKSGCSGDRIMMNDVCLSRKSLNSAKHMWKNC